MRYLRKVTSLALVAVAMTAIAASTATADVTVGNSGQFTIDNGTLHTGEWTQEGLLVHFSCDYDAEGAVEEDGSVVIENVVFNGGSSAHCFNWDDCDDAGWSGQIVGPGDPDYLGVADFEALMTVCVINGTSFQGIPLESRIHIDGDIEDQQWSWPVQNVVIPGCCTTPYLMWSDPLGMDRTDFEISLSD